MKSTFFKNKKALVIMAFIVLYQGSVFGNDTVSAYQALVKDWLALEKQNSALKKNWRESKPILQQRIKLLTTEKKLLTAQLTENVNQKSTVENKRDQLILQQNETEQEQQKLLLWLDNQWHKILDTSTQIAPPLLKSWQKQMSTYSEDLPASDKLSLVLLLWKKKKQFDHKITQLQSVVMTKAGKEILVEQLYIGSGLGWYVSADGTEYGLGKSTPNGWQWHKPDVDINQQVKQSIAMYKLQKEAGFIAYPLHMLNAKEVAL